MDQVDVEHSVTSVLLSRAMTQTVFTVYAVGIGLHVGNPWQYVASVAIGALSAVVWRRLALFLRSRGDKTGWLTLLLIAPYTVYAIAESVLPVCGVGAVAVYAVVYTNIGTRHDTEASEVDETALGCMRSISVTSENVFFVILGLYTARHSEAWTQQTLVLSSILLGLRLFFSVFYCYDTANWTMFTSLYVGVHNFHGPIGIVIAASLTAEEGLLVYPVMVLLTVASAVVCQCMAGFGQVTVLHTRTTTHAEDETLLGTA